MRRLLDYERSTCTVDGELVYRCAFPYRAGDELQTELIEQGALRAKADEKRGTIVVVTSDGYSYFLERRREERERERWERREARLIGMSALFSALCVIVGFLLGRLIA